MIRCFAAASFEAESFDAILLWNDDKELYEDQRVAKLRHWTQGRDRLNVDPDPESIHQCNPRDEAQPKNILPYLNSTLRCDENINHE